MGGGAVATRRSRQVAAGAWPARALSASPAPLLVDRVLDLGQTPSAVVAQPPGRLEARPPLAVLLAEGGSWRVEAAVLEYADGPIGYAWVLGEPALCPVEPPRRNPTPGTEGEHLTCAELAAVRAIEPHRKLVAPAHGRAAVASRAGFPRDAFGHGRLLVPRPGAAGTGGSSGHVLSRRSPKRRPTTL